MPADVTFGSPALQGASLPFLMIGNDAWVSLPPVAKAQVPGAKPFAHQTLDKARARAASTT